MCIRASRLAHGGHAANSSALRHGNPVRDGGGNGRIHGVGSRLHQAPQQSHHSYVGRARQGNKGNGTEDCSHQNPGNPPPKPGCGPVAEGAEQGIRHHGNCSTAAGDQGQDGLLLALVKVGSLLAQENLKGTEERGVDAQVDQYHAGDPNRADWFNRFSQRRGAATDDSGVRYRPRKVGQAHGRFPSFECVNSA
ncbi:hypothetical protein PJL18_01505 [Paenarthrobacter nicotinovorans]|nr:hypothetical protein [Paenarthrobacter nicotinovorans]